MEDLISFIIFILIFGVITIGRIIKAASGNLKNDAPEDGWENWAAGERQPQVPGHAVPRAKPDRDISPAPAPKPPPIITIQQNPEMPEEKAETWKSLESEIRQQPDQISNYMAQLKSADQEVTAQSLFKTFPHAVREAHRLQPRVKRKIKVRFRDKGDLRRAVLMSEVIGSPRAFDI